MVLKRAAFILAATVFCSSMSQAQGNIAFGGLSHDSTLPVEITADQLQVDQTDGSALFKGNVVAGQGDMRLSANEMKVEYSSGDAESTGRIQR